MIYAILIHKLIRRKISKVEKYLELLKEKFHYDEEMLQCLEKIIVAMIEYFGEDKKDIILNTIENCQIRIQPKEENAQEFLKSYFKDYQETTIPVTGAAFVESEYSLTEENQLEKRSLIYVLRGMGIFYQPFDFQKEENIAMIVHELCHAIKSSFRIQVDEEQMIEHRGMKIVFYHLDNETRTYKEVKSFNTGLEEATNSYDESKIMSILLGRNFEPTGYKAMTGLVDYMMKDLEIAEIIKTSQFSPNGNEWIRYFGVEASSFLSTHFDSMCKALYDMSHVFCDLERFDEIINRYTQLLNELKQFISNYMNQKQPNDSNLNESQQTMEFLRQIEEFQELEQVKKAR